MAPPDDPDDTTAPASATAPAAVPDPAPSPAADQTVKQLLDAATIADLERWFGLPSFQQLAEKEEPAPEDPDMVAVRERRAKAIAAVDPAMVEAHRRRVESGETLIRFQATIEVRIDPSLAQLDLAMIEQKQAMAEPREVEIPDQLREDLADCTPQAVLRDLHRPETLFDKMFEVVDMAAEQRLDIVQAVDEAMRTSWKLPAFEVSPVTEGRALIAELRQDRMRSIAHLLPTFPNRRVTE
ncbi:MAG TPA: hypothetical protein VN253_22265 [Kofleriaceae bacterium]|nr:hypothetical protein [Kofleriaceae bacterium]